MAKSSRKQLRARRHARVRRNVMGTASIPRMSVCCTQKHIYIQFIDDVTGHTMAAASSLEPEFKGDANAIKANMETAEKVAEAAAARAKKANISRVVFDRGGFKYHGRVKAVADAAREAGLTM